MAGMLLNLRNTVYGVRIKAIEGNNLAYVTLYRTEAKNIVDSIRQAINQQGGTVPP
jgi:hypothetical protein